MCEGWKTMAGKPDARTGGEQVANALDIGTRLRGIVGAPGIGVSGGVKDGMGIGNRTRQRVRVGDVAAHRNGAKGSECGIGIGPARQGPDLGAGGMQFAQQVLPEETGRSGQQNCRNGVSLEPNGEHTGRGSRPRPGSPTSGTVTRYALWIIFF